VASIGPFVIERPAAVFADDFESGDTASWDVTVP
jgi:hypothetical protein